MVYSIGKKFIGGKAGFGYERFLFPSKKETNGFHAMVEIGMHLGISLLSIFFIAVCVYCQ